MTIARYLLPAVLVGAFAAPAVAQYGDRGSRYRDIVPSVRPAGAEEPVLPTRQPLPPMPAGRPAAAVASLEQMTVPPLPTGLSQGGDPVGTLNGQPMEYAPGLPVGSYPSPYYTDGPGCCGPLGRDGRVGYEVYSYTGVNLPFGAGLPEFLNAGWTVGGGARTLFFDPTHTSAWTIDLGLSYTHNWAAGTNDPVNLFLRSPPVTNQLTGAVSEAPDRLVFTAIRGIHRSSFNFNFGRDVWLRGSGATGSAHGTNVRVGGWVGGRWGTSHVDLIPLDEVDGYSRRQNVFLSTVIGMHLSFDRPIGGWILFGGFRTEYGYDWTNLTPPLQGNIHNVNIQMMLGVRY